MRHPVSSVLSLPEVMRRERQIMHLVQLAPAILLLPLTVIQADLLPVDPLVWDVLTPRMELLAQRATPEMALREQRAAQLDTQTLEIPVVRDPFGL